MAPSRRRAARASRTSPLVLLLAVACVVPSLVLGQSPTADAPESGRPAATAPESAEWRLRVPLDSGQILVQVVSRAMIFKVISPAGTFAQEFASAAPLAEWIQAAEGLAPPVLGPADPGNPADTTRVWRLASVLLREPGDTAQHFDLTTFQLVRTSEDAAPFYALTGTNGAWDFSLRLTPAQFAALRAAVRGEAGPGALPYAYQSGLTSAETTWDETELKGKYRPVRPRGQPQFLYPKALRGSGIEGEVKLMFLVDSTGDVAPWSIQLIGKAHPRLAVLAANTARTLWFYPAQYGNRRIRMHVMKSFDFSEKPKR